MPVKLSEFFFKIISIFVFFLFYCFFYFYFFYKKNIYFILLFIFNNFILKCLDLMSAYKTERKKVLNK